MSSIRIAPTNLHPQSFCEIAGYLRLVQSHLEDDPNAAPRFLWVYILNCMRRLGGTFRYPGSDCPIEDVVNAGIEACEKYARDTQEIPPLWMGNVPSIRISPVAGDLVKWLSTEIVEIEQMIARDAAWHGEGRGSRVRSADNKISTVGHNATEFVAELKLTNKWRFPPEWIESGVAWRIGLRHLRKLRDMAIQWEAKDRQRESVALDSKPIEALASSEAVASESRATVEVVDAQAMPSGPRLLEYQPDVIVDVVTEAVTGHGGRKAAGRRRGNSVVEPKGESLAMVMLLDDPGIKSIAEVGRRMGVSRQTVYSWTTFMAAWEVNQNSRQSKGTPRRGSKNRDTGQIEAICEDPEIEFD